MTEADRKKAHDERQRRAALRSSVIQELRQQYSDAPEEIRERRDFQSERESREELHRWSFVYFIWVIGHLKVGQGVKSLLFLFQEKLWGVDDGAPQCAQASKELQKEKHDGHVQPAERHHTLQWHHSTDRWWEQAGKLTVTPSKDQEGFMFEISWNRRIEMNFSVDMEGKFLGYRYFSYTGSAGHPSLS